MDKKTAITRIQRGDIVQVHIPGQDMPLRLYVYLDGMGTKPCFVFISADHHCTALGGRKMRVLHNLSGASHSEVQDFIRAAMKATEMEFAPTTTARGDMSYSDYCAKVDAKVAKTFITVEASK